MLSASIEQTLKLARKYHEAEQSRQPKKEGLVCLADLPVMPTLSEETELKDFLRSLPAAEIYMTAAIMYLGRGDFDTSSGLREEYLQMSDGFHVPNWAINQMVEKSTLVAYLERGLRILRNEKVDRLLE